MNSGRDRDESIERLLQRSLARGGPSAAGACPDAETLAAWIDGGLDKPELTLVEAHASECARCQALLAAAVQTAPDPAPATSQEAWWRGRGLRWLVPLAAGAAAAVILWVVVPRDERADLPEQARAELPSPSQVPVDSLAPPQPEARNDDFATSAAGPGQSAKTSAVTDETRAAKDKNASVGASESDRAKENAPSEGKVADRLDGPGDQARDGRGAAAAAAAPPQSSLNETVALSRQLAKAAPIEIASPDPSVRWRVGAGGSVEHTTDGGTTWEALPTGVGADLTAGASPSRLVCWLVGRAGTVLLSTDGRTWRRVAFPEMADLAAIQATDARTAAITTADGRTFRTLDGGLSWR